MTVSMKVMSAGDGYKYLLKSVVSGDGERNRSTPMTRYYAEAGTPPGRWLGSCVRSLGDGRLAPGDPVTEEHLALLMGMGRDPISGEQLGRSFRHFASVSDRVALRTLELSSRLSAEQRADAVAGIEAEERELGDRRAVAGFDFTFSVPKSVSVLWGVADAGTQALIVEAHHEAVAEVMGLLERQMAATRTGRNAGDGAVAQADVVGVIAAAFDHWDSRLGDPQLHTHVVVSNKVKTIGDGRWRALDSRSLHAGVVAISEYYNAVLADRITRVFGLEWEQRERGKDRNPAWELQLVPDRLVRAFSGRARAIDIEKDRLIDEYIAVRGSRPSCTTVIRLRAQATLATRPAKRISSLADLTTGWRARADEILGTESPAWVRRLTGARNARSALRADDIGLDIIDRLGEAVVGAVSERRASWRHWNLWAEASRQTMGWRFATVEDREHVVGLIADASKRRSLRLTPPELASSPALFTRRDGTSHFRPRHSVIYSSSELLEAEDRLLSLVDDRGAPVLDGDAIERATRPDGDGQVLSDEQASALTRIAVSGRRVDLLIGPAGAGKTTAMRALRRSWENAHGIGSVVGLAPSAAAARVLGEDLGIACENIAKWLHDVDHGRSRFRSGQLIIIDEATLAGTISLDRLAGLAETAGAKVLLVGDWAQLQSVDAGGAFNLLAQRQPDVPELTEIHRFTHDWEKAASLDLRSGRTDVLRVYRGHERIHDGTTAQVIDAAYVAWRTDISAGRSSILVTDSASAVTELNTRARAERILTADTPADQEVRLADGTHASAGDLVITRHNDRRLQPLRGGWVHNGDRWRVLSVGRDGSLRVQRLGGGAITLPPAYVAQHVDLGYAVTAHRAQGITVDTAHVVVSSTTTRENLYVAMTRGRESNQAYVALDKPDDTHMAPEDCDVSASTVLTGVLGHTGAELSARQTIEAEQDRWTSIDQLAAEYETIAAVAQHDRWCALLQACGLTGEQLDETFASGSFGPLCAELRRAEANHVDVDAELPGLVAQRSLVDADDIGAVLASRIQHKRSQARQSHTPPDLIVGLIPIARGPMPAEMSDALSERRELIEARTQAMGVEAVNENARWVQWLGQPPTSPGLRDRWFDELTIVAAYRDRHAIGSDRVLGQAQSQSQNRDRAIAAEAIRRARALAAECLGDPPVVRTAPKASAPRTM